MDLLRLFRKKKQATRTSADNGVEGPTYLDGHSEPIGNPKDLQPFEWRRRLRTSNGERRFRIRYFGERHAEYRSLIVAPDEKFPMLVKAVAVDSGAELVLFDGCRHGYNALLCEATPEAATHRTADQWYRDESGADTFEVLVSVYRQADLDGEFGAEVDADGRIGLADGSRMPFEQVKRDAFDVIQVWAINSNGAVTEVLSEELA